MPAETPSTDPLVEPIVATPVFVLLHVPPVVPLLSAMLVPTQIGVAPEMPPGVWLTVTVVVTEPQAMV